MANVTYTVPNKSGTKDGDMVVKEYGTMTINTGDVVTVDQPCRGLMIFVQGDCTINGELTMTSRGPYANPTTSGANDSGIVNTNGLRFPFITGSGSDTITAAASLLDGCGTEARNAIAKFADLNGSNGVVKRFIRQGAAGGNAESRTTPGTNVTGSRGATGSTGQTGGGASGSLAYNGTGYAGSHGSCWGGGSVGGSENNYGGGSAATAWGGPGGNGGSNHNAFASGGAGNPPGTGGEFQGIQGNVIDVNAFNGGNGPGGAIVLIVGGNLTIGSNGKITAEGARSMGYNCTNGNTDWANTSGGAGGGNILIAHKGSYTNNGIVSANSIGPGRLQGNGTDVGGEEWSNGSSSCIGRNGGNGSVQVVNIS
jgi:hypothetical protein